MSRPSGVGRAGCLTRLVRGLLSRDRRCGRLGSGSDHDESGEFCGGTRELTRGLLSVAVRQQRTSHLGGCRLDSGHGGQHVPVSRGQPRVGRVVDRSSCGGEPVEKSCLGLLGFVLRLGVLGSSRSSSSDDLSAGLRPRGRPPSASRSAGPRSARARGPRDLSCAWSCAAVRPARITRGTTKRTLQSRPKDQGLRPVFTGQSP